MKQTNQAKHRIYTTAFASVYPHYVQKAEKKGRTRDEVDEVIRWLTGYTPGAQVVLRTLQKYGMVLSDGGGIALTAEDDDFNEHKWTDADVRLHPDGSNSRAFDQTPGATPVSVTDFAVIDTGPRIQETWDCVRTDVSLEPGEAPLFSNGFE
jgi:serine/threonine-protein kinase